MDKKKGPPPWSNFDPTPPKRKPSKVPRHSNFVAAKDDGEKVEKKEGAPFKRKPRVAKKRAKAEVLKNEPKEE